MGNLAQTPSTRKALAVARQALQAALALLEAVEHDAPDTDSATDPWVRIVAHTAGVVPRRVANAAAACGQIDTATRKGKSWIARRSAVDKWLSREGQSTEPAPTDAASLVARLGRRAGGAR